MLIICAGMKRSGSTLQYNIIRSLVEKSNRGKGEGYLLVTDDNEMPECTHKWISDEEIHVIKIHNLPNNVTHLLSARNVLICYIFRDLRDVAASLKRKSGRRGHDLITPIHEGITTFNRLRGKKHVLWQQYEVVMDNPRKAVRDCAHFIGLDQNQRIINATTTESTSMRTSQAREICVTIRLATMLRSLVRRMGGRPMLLKLGIPETIVRKIKMPLPRYHNKNSLLHIDHISKTKGASGVWKSILTKQEISMIESFYGKWLVKYGYTKD